MNSDSYFSIGRHPICQDYSISYNSGDLNYVIVADGCSSSKDTDIGARILAHSLKVNINRCKGWTPNSNYIASWASESKTSLNLEPNCLDSTLLSILRNEDTVQLTAWGDGLFVLKGKDQSIQTLLIDYEMNAPYYLNYLLDNKRDESYKRLGLKKRIRENNSVDLENIELGSTYLCDAEYKLSRSYNIKDLEWAAVLSDGIGSFIKDNTPVPIEEALKDLLQFKNFTGNFCERRLRKFLLDYHKEGITNFDDISLGCIYLGE
jgi:hypothetical protein